MASNRMYMYLGVSSSRWWWLSSSFCAIFSALFVTISPSEVVALTLTTGQRIASRKTNTNTSFAADATAPIPTSGIPLSPISPPSNPKEKQLQLQELQPKIYKSLFDLPAVENWGTRQGWKEHHLKTLYKFIMNDFVQSSPLSLEQRLAQAGFPKRYATHLVTEFALNTCSIPRPLRKVKARFVQAQERQQNGDDANDAKAPRKGPMWKQIQEGVMKSSSSVEDDSK